MKEWFSAWIKKNPEAIWALVLCGLAFALYANTLGHDYAWDDDIVIRYNDRVKSGFAGIPSHFVFRTRENFEDFTGYRPISLTSLSIDVGLFGLHPFGGHLMNVLYFCLLVLVMFRTFRTLFPNFHAAFAFFITLIFVIHPLRVEAVANIKSRDEILALIFALLSLKFFIEHYRSGDWLKLGLSALMIVLGALSKENALTYFAVLPLTIIFLEEGNLKKKAIGLLKFPILLGLVVLVFKFATGELPGSPTAVASKGYFESLTLGNCMAVKFPNTWEHIGNSIFLFGVHIKKFLWPNDLVYFSGFDMYPIKNWTTDRLILGPILFYIIISTILPIVFFKRLRIFGFGAYYFMATIIIYLQLPGFLIADTIADRFMTMPSLGLGIILVWGLYKLLRIPFDQNPITAWRKGGIQLPRKIRIPAIALTSFMLALTIVFGGMTIARNRVWKNNRTLFSSDLSALDNCARAHYYYANQLVADYSSAPNQSEIRKEIEAHFQRAIDITPESYYAFTRFAEAQLYIFQDYVGAERTASAGLKYYKESADLWHYKGKANYYQGRYQVAAEAFQTSLSLDDSHEDTREFWARSLERNGDFAQAMTLINEGIQIDPNYLFYYDVLSDTYWDAGDTLNSFLPILQLLEKDGNNPTWWKKIIGRYQLKGDNENALRYYNEARNRGLLE